MSTSPSSIINLEAHFSLTKTSLSILAFDSHPQTTWLSQLRPLGDMFPSSLLLPSVPRDLVPTTSAGIGVDVPDGPSVGRNAQGETFPPYPVWHYIVEFRLQLDSRQI